MEDASNTAAMTKLVLLIDGENLDSKYAEDLLEKAGKLGTLVTKRVYGHRDNSRMIKWEKMLGQHGLTNVDVSKISRAKDTADFKMVVEAMDMLHGRQLDGFCIASSDGDFSALAERIRANALPFYGFGEGKAPPPYKQRCTQFFDLTAAKRTTRPSESRKPALAELKPASHAASPQKSRRPKIASAKKVQATASPTSISPPRAANAASAPVPLDKLLAAISEARGSDGWTHLRDLGHALSRNGLSPTKLGYKLPRLVRAYPDEIEVDKRGNDTYVRRKPS
jgi:hypothetical protein